MIRTKVTLVYIVLVAGLTAAAIALVHFEVKRVLDQDAEVALRRAATLAEQSARLDEAALLAKAEFVAQEDRLYRSLLGEFVNTEGEGEGEGEEGDAPKNDAEFKGQRHLDAHEKLTAQKYKLDEFAKEAQTRRNISRPLLQRAPHDFDVFLVVDETGEGVAALGKDLYSWFGDDITQTHPEIKEVLEGGRARVAFWQWSYTPTSERKLHRVAIAPVRRTPEEKPAGAVVIGSLINDGLAKQQQRLLAGVTKDPQTSQHIDEEFLATAPDIAYFKGDQIVGSTFDTHQQQAILSSLQSKNVFEKDEPEQLLHFSLGDTPHIALIRMFEDPDAKSPVGVAVFTDMAEVTGPLNQLRMNILFVSVGFLLLGAGILFFMLVRWTKPLEDLETGIQEVIAGNKDYSWQPQQSHELHASLAQSLNLMSAYLQGKPMPDEDVEGSGWSDLMGDTSAAKKSGPTQVTGIDLSTLSAPPKDGAEKGDDEPSES